jgi:AcrR family transcriptional regulator
MSRGNSVSAHGSGHRRLPHQLPPGRHGLSRDFVKANQRERMLDAVADVVSFQGYVAMSVEDIVGAAGVSRRTFYDHFTGKEDAFLQAFDRIARELLRRVNAAFDHSATFAEAVIGCLRECLEFAASEPRFAEMCIGEVLAAGPAAIERRNAVLGELAELLERSARTVPDGLSPPEVTAEALIGGVYEVVYARVLQGQAAELPALLPDLAYSVMLPYLGHERAERELHGLGAALAAA